MFQISTREADQALLRFARVIKARETSFLERIKQLRRLGVPSGVPKGRGAHGGRSLAQMLEIALAIRLLEAGLASVDVARLVKQEWALASAVLGSLEADYSNLRPKLRGEIFWIAEVQGLAAYQQPEPGREPRLAVMAIFEGERLEDKIDPWISGRGWTVIVIRAREVVHQLLTACADTGIAPLRVLHEELRLIHRSEADALRSVVKLRATKRPSTDRSR